MLHWVIINLTRLAEEEWEKGPEEVEGPLNPEGKAPAICKTVASRDGISSEESFIPAKVNAMGASMRT